MKPSATPSPPSNFSALAPWYAAEGLAALANNLYITGAIFYAKNTLGRSNADCLWLTASWGLLYIFLSLMAGRLSEKWGPRTLVLRATLGGAVAGPLGLLAVAFPRMWVLVLCLAAFNVVSTPIWPALESAITRMQVRATLSRRIAIYNVMWSGGAAVAMTLSGVINNLDPRAIFLTAGAASLLAFLLVRFLTLPADKECHAPEPIVHSPRAQTLLHMAWLVNPMGFLTIFVLIAVIPQILKSAGNLSPAIGGVWAFVRVLGFVLFSAWTGWHYRVRYMLIAYLLMAGSFLVMLLMPNVDTLLMGQVIFGLGVSFVYASSLYYAMHVSSGAGGHAGIHEAMIGSGMFLGPFVGAIAAMTGKGLPLIAVSVSAVLLVGLGVLAALAWRFREVV